MAATLKEYGLSSTTGDRYGAGWIPDAFSKVDVSYTRSEVDRSEAYLNVLPKFMAGKVRLLDNARLISQFASLERRSTTSGRDRVDHGPNGADDCSNAAALVLSARASGFLSYEHWIGDVPESFAQLPYFFARPGGGLPWLR